MISRHKTLPDQKVDKVERIGPNFATNLDQGTVEANDIVVDVLLVDEIRQFIDAELAAAFVVTCHTLAGASRQLVCTVIRPQRELGSSA